MHPEGRSPGGGEEGWIGEGKGTEVADPKEASIDKTLLHYITPDARASPRSHNINACCISRPRRHSAPLRIFRYAPQQNLPNIGKNISRSQMCIRGGIYIRDSRFFPILFFPCK